VKTAKFCSRACKDKSQVDKPTWNKGLKGVQVAWNRGLGKYSRICKCGNEKPNLYAKKCKECHLRIGQIPWNKGKKMSLEIRKKFSLARKGKYKGKENHVWKGGITPETIRLRNEFVRTIQKEVLKRDDYICRICHKRGGELTVDHIQSWSEYAEGRFSMDNCRTLCRACHYEITFGKPMPKDNQWGRRTIIWR